MRFYSITGKLLLLISVTFLVTAVSVVMIADRQIKRIVDAGQNEIYRDKLSRIIAELARVEERLQRTGLVEAYKAGFQASLIRELRDEYYHKGRLKIYPFILDRQRRIIMHPFLPKGSRAPQKYEWTEKIVANPSGNFMARFQGRDKWYIYRNFAPWGWWVCYCVPLEIKYRDSRHLHTMLFNVIAVITLLALLVVSFVLRRFTRPIRKLTASARAISAGDLDRKVAVSSRDEIGVLAASFETMRSNLARKIAEMANIIDSMPSLLVMVDVDGRVVQWNKVAAAATGLSAKEAVGRIFSEVLPHLAAEFESVEKALRTGKEQRKSRCLRIDGAGRSCYEDIVIYPLVGAVVLGAVIRVDDVSERVKVEEMMIQSEKMMSVGGLAAGMAHEINNPLGIIVQTVQNIERRVSPDLPANLKTAAECGCELAVIRDYLTKRDIPVMLSDVRTAVARAAEIVRNMLQFSRQGESLRQPVRITDLVDRAIELAVNDYDLKKSFDFKFMTIKRLYDREIPEISVAVTEIEQVVLNLLKNAAQAMAESGMSANEGSITIRVGRESDSVLLEFSDNGPGMPEDVRKRIFEPFYTTKPVGQGTGLGLSVAYMIITNRHQGSIEVRSTPGQGTTFIIRLPLAGFQG